MERYNKEKRVIIVKTHYKYGESYAETVRKIRGIFGRRNAAYQSTVQRMIKKFEETGSIMDSKLPVRHRARRSLDNIAAVSESVAESPGTSIRHCSQELDIPRSTMQRTLTKDLHLHAYRIELTQELKPTDHVQRREFVNCVLENQKVNGNLSKKIVFSDEAHFQLDGCVDTQNCRIWAAGNPRVIHEKPLHAQRTTVWCGFWAGGVIRPYFFAIEPESAVTLNGVPYRNKITEFCGLSWMVWIWKTSVSSRTAQSVTLRAKQLSCCEKNFLAVSSHAMAIRIGHGGRAI